MKLTKYEHACFTLEKDGKVLVVDPGAYTSDLPSLENVVAVVVTHVHPDHFDTSALEALFASNPDLIVYSPKQVDDNITSAYSHKSAAAGDGVVVGPFELEFFGGEHAVIHSSLPVDENLGVMINNVVYYPGDSFTNPNKPVQVLALPVAAPWLKLSEVMDYLGAINPDMVFPTHDAISSLAGKKLADGMLPNFLKGGSYKRIDGTTIEV